MKRTHSKLQHEPPRDPRNTTRAATPAKSAPASAAQTVRIVVVDGHRFMREVISAIVARQSGRYIVVAEHGAAETAVEACEQLAPDLLILDINLPRLNGIDAVSQIKKAAPRTRILLCTAFVTDDRVVDAWRSGADGFVEKTNTWSDFIEAIEHVSNDEQFFRAYTSPPLCAAGAKIKHGRSLALQEPLTEREKEVVTLIAHGHTTNEITMKSSLTIGTIETHPTNLVRKLKERNIAELVVYAA